MVDAVLKGVVVYGNILFFFFLVRETSKILEISILKQREFRFNATKTEYQLTAKKNFLTTTADIYLGNMIHVFNGSTLMLFFLSSYVTSKKTNLATQGK